MGSAGQAAIEAFPKLCCPKRMPTVCALPRLPMPQPQHLHIQAPVSSPEAPAAFDSAVLQPLQQLASLSLGSFSAFDLAHLPPSLRRLRLRYDSQARLLSVPQLPEHARWAPGGGLLLACGIGGSWLQQVCGMGDAHVRPHPAAALPPPPTCQLSFHCSLDLLQVEKPGALGICIDDFWGRVRPAGQLWKGSSGGAAVMPAWGWRRWADSWAGQAAEPGAEQAGAGGRATPATSDLSACLLVVCRCSSWSCMPRSCCLGCP